MAWYGMVWYGMVWYGMVWYGMVWYGMVWYGMVWYGMVWYGMVWYGMVWYGMVWYGMVWYGMVWYGMVWYGMVWYGMVCCCCCCCEGTQHVPAGEIARHALPGQGAREQSAGVTLAGRVPTTTEGGGGGGAPWIGGGGGGGARVEEGGATCGSYPGALPRLAGGELLVLCEAAVVGVEGGAVTLEWGRHARVHGHSAPCPNIPQRWPFLVCSRGVAGGGWPVLLAFYGGEGRPRSCCVPAPSHLCSCFGVAASSPVVRARARVGHGGGRAQGREHKSTLMGIQLLACCVWFRCCPLVPVPVPCLREAARHSRRGVEARAGRMGSGGRPRRKRRHAGAGGPAGGRQWP